jgi:excisionase family DNA binding protein
MIRRREFTTLLGAASAWPVVARAQRRALPVIGYLYPGTPSNRPEWRAIFLQRLHELGWIEGRTVSIESRWADGRLERYAEIAAEFARLKVDVIVTQATEPATAAKQATSVIPIVFVGVGDPVGNKIVASLARQTALPPTLAPRLIGRDAAAAYVSVSPNTFDEMVSDGRMPHPKLLGGRRRAWDLRALDAAIDRLPVDGKDVQVDETWGDVDAA